MRSALSVSPSRWLWIALAAAPLAVVGCQGNRTATSTNAPGDQRVAGERQEEPSPEVMQAIRDGNLPETFMFGGRVWRGHELHRTTRDRVGGMDAAATGSPGSTDSQGGQNAFDYHPVADLKVEGHVIYRRGGMDEAVTDNIFLMASGAGATSGAEGATGEGAAGTGTQGAETAANEVVFIEYDPVQSMDASADVNQVIQSAGLPETLTWNGKTFTPREVQVYDADVFDDVEAVQGMTGGHKAYQGDNKNELFVMGEVSSMPMGGGTGDTGTPGTGTATPGAGETGPAGEPGAAGGETMMFSGPVFVRYEQAGADNTGAADTSTP